MILLSPLAFEKIVGIEVAHPGIEKAKESIYEDAPEDELKKNSKNPLEVERAAIERASKPESKHNRNLFRSSKHRKYYTYYQWVCFA